MTRIMILLLSICLSACSLVGQNSHYLATTTTDPLKLPQNLRAKTNLQPLYPVAPGKRLDLDAKDGVDELSFPPKLIAND